LSYKRENQTKCIIITIIVVILDDNNDSGRTDKDRIFDEYSCGEVI